uniref:Uncharacterized protein n=1 Tax=Eutreptiella gymnastica TaxID=73025 RepID=A0A7S1IGW1_9EUGL|mmetsp:Transcript_16501/g.29341  ORF Transcript_16501/g.29341 Transcript_16501/m.29341 type:complete len:641 (+) Transcript_16501:76-1998(+)
MTQKFNHGEPPVAERPTRIRSMASDESGNRWFHRSRPSSNEKVLSPKTQNHWFRQRSLSSEGVLSPETHNHWFHHQRPSSTETLPSSFRHHEYSDHQRLERVSSQDTEVTKKEDKGMLWKKLQKLGKRQKLKNACDVSASTCVGAVVVHGVKLVHGADKADLVLQVEDHRHIYKCRHIDRHHNGHMWDDPIIFSFTDITGDLGMFVKSKEGLKGRIVVPLQHIRKASADHRSVCELWFNVQPAQQMAALRSTPSGLSMQFEPALLNVRGKGMPRPKVPLGQIGLVVSLHLQMPFYKAVLNSPAFKYQSCSSTHKKKTGQTEESPPDLLEYPVELKCNLKRLQRALMPNTLMRAMEPPWCYLPVALLALIYHAVPIWQFPLVIWLQTLIYGTVKSMIPDHLWKDVYLYEDDCGHIKRSLAQKVARFRRHMFKVAQIAGRVATFLERWSNLVSWGDVQMSAIFYLVYAGVCVLAATMIYLMGERAFCFVVLAALWLGICSAVTKHQRKEPEERPSDASVACDLPQTTSLKFVVARLRTKKTPAAGGPGPGPLEENGSRAKPAGVPAKVIRRAQQAANFMQHVPDTPCMWHRWISETSQIQPNLEDRLLINHPELADNADQLLRDHLLIDDACRTWRASVQKM